MLKSRCALPDFKCAPSLNRSINSRQGFCEFRPIIQVLSNAESFVSVLKLFDRSLIYRYYREDSSTPQTLHASNRSRVSENIIPLVRSDLAVRVGRHHHQDTW